MIRAARLERNMTAQELAERAGVLRLLPCRAWRTGIWQYPWGNHVIINRLTELKGIAMGLDTLDEMNYMLQSGSDRISALDFQTSATEYVSRLAGAVDLTTLIEAADLVERGGPLPQELDEAIWHGISIGGARPKAQVTNGNRKMIAKFIASKDQHSVLKSEYIAMKIAQACRLA
tara:strand:+ start:217 stop:741 length:525 start_codon:yes stop_codon:yes gene_type:complete